jgi:hypothetical protein
MRQHTDAGWSSPVARRAHNPKAAGSNPAPATNFTQVVEPWCSGLTCLPVTQEIAGSNPVGSAIFLHHEALAQLVEHLTFNQGVVGSNPTCLTIFILRAYGGIGRRTRLRI